MSIMVEDMSRMSTFSSIIVPASAGVRPVGALYIGIMVVLFVLVVGFFSACAFAIATAREPEIK